LNKNPFFYLFHLFHERKRGGYTLRHDFESEEKKKRAKNQGSSLFFSHWILFKTFVILKRAEKFGCSAQKKEEMS